MPSFAFVLLVVGLPIVLATAIVQEGAPRRGDGDPEASKAGASAEGAESVRAHGPGDPPGRGERPAQIRSSPLARALTWKRVALGALGGGLLLVVAVGGYFALRAAGIGPSASLVAQGVFEEGEAVVLADFRNSTPDSLLAPLVTEALRADLASSGVITVVPAHTVRETLGRMQVDPTARLGSERAAEVAIRMGVKAVLEGEVGMAGGGYILLATLRAPETGEALGSFRRTASGDAELIAAIDALSNDIRERAGESLREIRSGPGLSTVTTGSLDALRLYTEALKFRDVGDNAGALRHFSEAVELDPEFAMAWRGISVSLMNLGQDNPRRIAAATRAFELRERLSEYERNQTAGFYHLAVTGDVEAAIEAWEALLSRYPDDRLLLGNMSVALRARTRYEESLEYIDRSVAVDSSWSAPQSNRVSMLTILGRYDEAQSAQAFMEAQFPQNRVFNMLNQGQLDGARGRFDEQADIGRRMASDPNLPSFFRTIGHVLQIDGLRSGGRFAEWESQLQRELALLREEGRDLDFIEFSWLHLTVARLLLGPGPELEARIRAFLSTGVLDSGLSAHPLGGSTLPYREFSVITAAAGMADEAEALLERWEHEGGAMSEAPLRETRQVVTALLDPDPEAAAERLARFQTDARCPRCYQWERADRLQAAGRYAEAIEVYESMSSGVPDLRLAALHFALREERLGQLYEAVGQPERAAEHYARFTELWAEADPIFQPRVERARERAIGAN